MAAIVANSMYESICPGSYSRVKAKSTNLIDEGLGCKLVVSFMHVQNSQIIVGVLRLDLRSLLSEVDGFIEIFQDFIASGDPVKVLKLVGLQL